MDYSDLVTINNSDLQKRELIELTLPKEVSGYRIIDHNHAQFLLANQYVNLIFAGTANLAVSVVSP